MSTRTILCPTDFSEHSEAAVHYASCLAKSMDAKIHFLHVEDDAAPYDAGFAGYVPSIADLDRCQVALQKVQPTVPGIACEHHCMVGRPADAINDFAKKHAVDMIVLGTHGRTGVARVVLGSVAEVVVRHAPCPVLTVRATTDVHCSL